MKKLLFVLMVGLMALSLMGISSCGKPVDTVSGGGWIPAKGECGKATFGFNIQTAYDGGLLPGISGEFEYKDHVYKTKDGLKVQFHGQFDKCGFPVGNLYVAEGTYRTQPPVFDSNNEVCTGKFIVTVADNGQPHDGGKDDYIQVDITSGPLTGYHHFGFLRGGNITITYVVPE
jgi:hypothetical protein